jgi:hypothetical protein
MPSYSFHQRFVTDIQSGKKRHTIRAKRKHAPRVGQTFHGFYAMRTAHCTKLVTAPIVKVEDIRIQVMEDSLWIWVDGVFLDPSEVTRLAQADGFASHSDMAAWWRRVHGFGTFRGDIIHWGAAPAAAGAEPFTAAIRSSDTPTDCWRSL